MKIEDILNIKYPILQGGMTRIAEYRLVSAVSNAGGLGILASYGLTPEQLRVQIKKVKQLTDKPFAVNLMLKDKNIEAFITVIIEENVKIVSTGAGSPKPYMSIFKANHIKVIAVIPNVGVAKKMESLGVDIVVAEGMESGGHIGELTTMTLVPQVVEAVDIPVVAAGGVANGKTMLAAFVLGAKGVQIGTAFLVTKECVVNQAVKNKILEADEMSTTIIGTRLGMPLRTIKNEKVAMYKKLEQITCDNESSEALLKEQLLLLKNKMIDTALDEGNVENGIVMAGQVSGLLNQQITVSEYIEQLMFTFNEAKQKLLN